MTLQNYITRLQHGKSAYMTCGALVLVMLATTFSAFGESATPEAMAREVFEARKNTVVTMQLVITTRFSFGGDTQEQENNVEISGTVISPEGLTVASLSETDPSSLMRSMMGNRQDMQASSEINDVKIMLPEGDEIEAQVVLRDNELDLAFILPLERPEIELDYVSLDNYGSPELFDQVLAINRLGSLANRVYSGALERIEAIVERPRKYYIPGSDPTNTGMGCPAFTLSGDFVGIFVVRAVEDSGPSRSMGNNMMGIVVSADDIAYSAEQVPSFEDLE